MLLTLYRNPRIRYEICSKLIIKTPERYHLRRPGVFIVNFEHILHRGLVFPLLTLNMEWDSYCDLDKINS